MWCVKGHSLTHSLGNNELQALCERVMVGEKTMMHTHMNVVVN